MRKSLSFLALCMLASGTTAFKLPYPNINEVPPVDSPQVQQWISEIDFSKIPNIPVVPCDMNGSPVPPANATCDWSYNNCVNGDIVVCPKGYWGLAYDDGPTLQSPRLYNYLQSQNQKATLFYIGSNVLLYWSWAQMACNAGHHIASHSWSHHASTCLTNEQFIAEIKWTEAIIQEICGVIPKYFRPPYGDIDDRIRALLKEMGYISVLWDVDTSDWELQGGTKTVQEINANFARWAAGNATDQTGHISLEHELTFQTVTVAIENYPVLKSAFDTQTVAACLGDLSPYQSPNHTKPDSTASSTSATSVSGTPTPTTLPDYPEFYIPKLFGRGLPEDAEVPRPISGSPTTKFSSFAALFTGLLAALWLF